MPVLINAFGSPERMAAALGVERLDELSARVAKLLDLRMPGSFFDKLRKLGDLFDVAKAGPKRVRSAACQEVVETDRPSLATVPIIRCWPGDAGRYITLPMVFTRDPVTGARNVGMYRLQVFDDQTLGMHWQIHKGSAEHHRVAEEQKKPMEVAVALGGDPCSIYAGSAPLPPGIDEMVFSGWLRGSGVPMVSCKTVDLEVPAEAEIVLEGWVDPAERRLEGPFGDHTGYYSLARDYPVFHLKAITRRKNPIYPTTIVGRPPQEDYWLGKATERIFLPIIRLLLPEVVDMNMPAEGVFHNLVIVSIKKRYPGQARKVMYALWGLGLMMLAKTIVVVSEHVDVQNLSEVAWRATGNIDPKRDVVLLEGPAGRPRPRRHPPSLRRQARHRRHGEERDGRHRPGVARGDRHERRRPLPREPPLDGIRALVPATASVLAVGTSSTRSSSSTPSSPCPSPMSRWCWPPTAGRAGTCSSGSRSPWRARAPWP